MPTPSPSTSPSSRRRSWLLGIVISAAIVVAVSLLGDRDPPAPAPEEPPAEERPPAPVPVPAPAPVSRPAPPPPTGSAASQPPGQSSAPGAPELPPTAVAPGTGEDLEIPPEAPQTPEWKLGKTELILDSLGKRVQRLEKEIQAAEARGDQETARRQRILLDRSRQRMAALERDAAAMRADGGGR
jgi:hypothetical protein